MFQNPFSFDGRIRRTEYGVSLMIYIFYYFILTAILELRTGLSALIVLVCIIPLGWFMIAQAAKRCHDVGFSGWRQLIPFCPLYLLFQEGQSGENEYGSDPKAEPIDYSEPNHIMDNSESKTIEAR